MTKFRFKNKTITYSVEDIQKYTDVELFIECLAQDNDISEEDYLSFREKFFRSKISGYKKYDGQMESNQDERTTFRSDQ